MNPLDRRQADRIKELRKALGHMDEELAAMLRHVERADGPCDLGPHECHLCRISGALNDVVTPFRSLVIAVDRALEERPLT